MGVDSNHRSLRRQIYSLLPLATREPIHFIPGSPTSKSGAGDGTRTRNLLITNQLLCQLSYASASPRPGFYRQQSILYTFSGICQALFSGDECKKARKAFVLRQGKAHGNKALTGLAESAVPGWHSSGCPRAPCAARRPSIRPAARRNGSRCWCLRAAPRPRARCCRSGRRRANR